MKVYIASPFFNPAQLERVQVLENFLSTVEIDYFSPRSFGVIKDMTPEEKELRMEEIYNKNIEQIFDCNVIVCIVDEPDTGTVFELGFAAGLNMHAAGKKIITASFTGKPVNVMLRYCIYSHATCQHSLANLLMSIKNKTPFVFVAPEVNE